LVTAHAHILKQRMFTISIQLMHNTTLGQLHRDPRKECWRLLSACNFVGQMHRSMFTCEVMYYSSTILNLPICVVQPRTALG
jgi:hypothetical protein